ncbi:MAG: dihydropteroate synthase, partial [Bacteroidaceae bacterium]
LSVDTFRADVAKMCVEEFGVAIVNDISGGSLDKNMFQTVAALQVPYILMHMKGIPQTMQNNPMYDLLVRDIFLYFAEKVSELRQLGVNDIVLDPGFGFAKNLSHNYELLNYISDFSIFDLPLLVGFSRKSMIYQLLENTPSEALNGTTVLNTIALLQGAQILRVHDVREAVEAVKIVETMKQAKR